MGVEDPTMYMLRVFASSAAFRGDRNLPISFCRFSPVHLGVGNGVALKDCPNRILGNVL